LCAWYSQPGTGHPLSVAAFEEVLLQLLVLFEHEPRARDRYAAQIAAEAEDPLDGGLTRTTRFGLAELSKAWSSGKPHPQIVEAFLVALKTPNSGTGLASLRGMKPPPRF
jgi:hypothetical protein